MDNFKKSKKEKSECIILVSKGFPFDFLISYSFDSQKNNDCDILRLERRWNLEFC